VLCTHRCLVLAYIRTAWSTYRGRGFRRGQDGYRYYSEDLERTAPPTHVSAGGVVYIVAR
jgi:hypothetical protein